jgi:hypothetical protein
MTPRRPWGPRLAAWWVGAYTATAPEQDAADRRAEIAADVADELRTGDDRTLLSRRISGRVLRGVAADLLWRISVERAPGRAAWHLAHPSALLGALTALLLPLVLIGDALRGPWAATFGRALGLVDGAVVLLSAAILSVAITALLRRLTDRTRSPRAGPPRNPLRTARHWAGVAMCVAGATAAIWRFVPGPWGQVAAVSWAAFGLALVAWLAATTGLAIERVVRRRPS